MSTASLTRVKSNQIHLAFEVDKLESLLHEGKLHAADFQCLDSASKRSVWRMLLSNVAAKLGCR